MVCGLLQVLDGSCVIHTPSIDLWLEISEEQENIILFNPWFKNPSSDIGHMVREVSSFVTFGVI